MGALHVLTMRKRTLFAKILSRLAALADALACASGKALRRRQLAEASLRHALDIHTHMTPAELSVLYDLASNVPPRGAVLEIGSYLGASSCHLGAALSLREGRLYCVDTWANETMPGGERDTFADFQRNTSAISAFITPVRRRSDKISASDFKLPLDLVFVDADHAYAAVKRDFETVRDWIRDGGALALHDCTYFEAVSRVLGEILASGEWQLMGNVDSLVWLRKIGSTGAFPNPMEPRSDERS